MGEQRWLVSGKINPLSQLTDWLSGRACLSAPQHCQSRADSGQSCKQGCLRRARLCSPRAFLSGLIVVVGERGSAVLTGRSIGRLGEIEGFGFPNFRLPAL